MPSPLPMLHPILQPPPLLRHALTVLMAWGFASISPPLHAADEPAATAPRPRVGLVLGGGGARGAAHAGVLEVLEQLHVPVDCVAGTSMGAVAAGAWAAGLSPAQMRAALARADWADMFQDNPNYTELNHRNKRLSQQFLPGSEAGVKDGSAVTPAGLVSAQKFKLFFNHLVNADAGERLLEELPLPVSIIATDIGTGERVVLREGSLTQAMRASMSVPGLMAPLESNGRKLVDGGLVDNLPVREVRERCRADVVIAVNVGSAPLRPEEVTGLVTVTAQVIALLTEQNVQATLATLKPTDIYIRPDLGSITAADFARHAEAADRGRSATEAVAARLRSLAVGADDWAAWRQRTTPRMQGVPRIDEVQVAGLGRTNEEVARRHVEQRAGAPLNTAALDRDMLRIYGDGWYESVDYAVLRQDGRQVLRVMPIEKSWGPDYVRLGVKLDTSLSQGSSYLLRVGYHRTWINRNGGELLFVGELGSSTGASVDWYQPFTRARDWFGDFNVSYVRERNDIFELEQRVAEYRSARARAELLGGFTFGRLGDLRAGWRETRVNDTLETGVDVLAPLHEQRSGGWFVGLDLDQLDRLYFPRRGWSAQAEWYRSERRGYTRASFDLRGAVPLSGFVFGTRLSWIGSPSGALPFQEAARLGGFLNLTGFASGQLIGDDVAYGHLRAERIIGSLPLGLRGDMRLGLALELGHVGTAYTSQKRDGVLNSLAIYLGGETPFGPVYLGVGRGSGGSVNAYLFVGTP